MHWLSLAIAGLLPLLPLLLPLLPLLLLPTVLAPMISNTPLCGRRSCITMINIHAGTHSQIQPLHA
jgi:hypothetical protein